MAIAGFSRANHTWLPINPNYITLNVESQLAAPSSHIKVFKLLIEARKAEAVMMGELDIQVLKQNVLVFTRSVTLSTFINTSSVVLRISKLKPITILKITIFIWTRT